MTVSEYYALGPADYGPIVSFEFQQIIGDDGLVKRRAVLLLSRRPDLSLERLRLTFHDVINVVFRPEDWSLTSLGLVEIQEREMGLIVTEEQGQLKLTCRAFEASIEGDHR